MDENRYDAAAPIGGRRSPQLAELAGAAVGAIVIVYFLVTVAGGLLGDDDAGSSRDESVASLTAADVTGNLESRGFDCEGPDQEPSGGVAYACQSGDLVVYITGQAPTEINNVSASAIGASDGAGADFLGYVASVPYDGAQPAQAREWVEANIADGGSMAIGSVRFRLSGPDGGRVLDITAP